MRRETAEKAVLTAIMAVWWLLLPVTGYYQGDCRLWPHVAYMWSHVNFWHIAGNLIVLWIMRGQLYVVESLLIAFVASFIPAWSIYGDMGMTLGFSGVLFAIGGIKWGAYSTRRYGRYVSFSAFERFACKALPFALIGIVIPHLNWCIHLYTLIIGYVYGRCRG